jgi:hypothetical protein
MRFQCLKPGCPVDCGTRRDPGCGERALGRALFFMLIAVLLLSVVVGFWDLNTAPRSG